MEENNKQTEALQMRRAIPEIGFKLPNHKRLAIQAVTFDSNKRGSCV